jgi:hypothetical protein
VDLVVGEFQVHRRYGVGEVTRLRRSDDGCGHDRLAQHPGQGDLGHVHAAFRCDGLDGLDDGLVGG